MKRVRTWQNRQRPSFVTRIAKPEKSKQEKQAGQSFFDPRLFTDSRACRAAASPLLLAQSP